MPDGLFAFGHLGFPGFPPGTVVAFGGLPVRLFPSVLPPGTVVAAGGPSVPIGRSGWKQIASTWNSDIGNGRFCGHPPFPVEGRGKELSILVLLVFPSGTDILFGGLPVPFPFSAPPPGTVVAVGGLPVPFGRSRWKHFAPTWNSDRRNGRFVATLRSRWKVRAGAV